MQEHIATCSIANTLSSVVGEDEVNWVESSLPTYLHARCCRYAHAPRPHIRVFLPWPPTCVRAADALRPIATADARPCIDLSLHLSARQAKFHTPSGQSSLLSFTFYLHDGNTPYALFVTSALQPLAIISGGS